MLNYFKTGVIGLLMIASTCFAEHSAKNEPSKYGKFVITENSKGCVLSFMRSGAAKSSKLFFVDGATIEYTFPAINNTEEIGKTKMPILLADGNEFHMFEIVSGGNSAEGVTYYPVVISPTKAWSVTDKDSFFESEVKSVEIVNNKAVFTVPPTTTSTGTVYTVGLGSITKLTIPALPRNVVSKKTVELTGKMIDGCHASGFIPMLEIGEQTISFTDAGKCNLESMVGKMVSVTASVKEWSDGAKDIVCISVRQIAAKHKTAKRKNH